MFLKFLKTMLFGDGPKAGTALTSTEEKEPSGFFSTDFVPDMPKSQVISEAMARTFRAPKPVAAPAEGVAMDTAAMDAANKQDFNSFIPINATQLAWYSYQGFLGWQTCAM